MERDARIFVAGGETLIGSALLRALDRQGYKNLVGGPSQAPDLADARVVDDFFRRTRPGYVFHAAGKSGGISANMKYPADLMLDNLLTACHVVRSSFHHGTDKLLFLASSCTYPRACPQPMKEEALLTGPLEPTNKAYAVAKIAGMELCRAYRNQYGAKFITAIPANAFGPGDDFSPEDSHVIAALIRRMHEARLSRADVVEVWGTGAARREFIFADDLADAAIFIMRHYNGEEPINLGSGAAFSIAELASMIKDVTGFTGQIRFDRTKPDGMPVKILDSAKIQTLGWRVMTSMRAALEETYAWYLAGENKPGTR